ncbi:hypothetical protein BGW38_008323, partial [Lunasporangiospora selenospora]
YNMNIKSVLLIAAIASMVSAADRCETKKCNKQNVTKNCCRGAGRKYFQSDVCAVKYGYGRTYDECCESRGTTVSTLSKYYDCFF